MPVRKVSNRGGNIIGKFPSLKMKRMVQFESTIERDYVYVLDYEVDVTSFEEQPFVIEYRYADKTRRYTPDFHVVRSGRNVLVECKPADLVSTDENQRKFAAARQICALREWEFEIVTDIQLRSGSRLSNIKLLRQYACHTIRPEMKGWIYTLLQNAPIPPTINQIQSAASHPVLVFACLMYMAHHHEVAIPLDDGLISVSSPVSMLGGKL